MGARSASVVNCVSLQALWRVPLLTRIDPFFYAEAEGASPSSHWTEAPL